MDDSILKVCAGIALVFGALFGTMGTIGYISDQDKLTCISKMSTHSAVDIKLICGSVG
jgi:hypothetical protein